VEAGTVASPKLRYQTSPTAQAFAGAKLAELNSSAIRGITRRWLVQWSG